MNMILFNFIVGVAMAASATVFGGIEKGLKAFLKGLRNKLTDSFSEFIGDGSREFFKFVKDKIENLFARKKAKEILNGYFKDKQDLQKASLRTHVDASTRRVRITN